VRPDSPAAKAGIERDDVIVHYDGHQVTDAGSFRSRVASTTPGTEVDIIIMRNGKELTKTVKIGTLPKDAEQAAQTGGAQEEQQGAHVGLGLSVQNLTDQIAQQLGYEGQSGVVVTEVAPDSAASDAGIKPGALIQEVNRTKVHNTREFQDALKSGDHAKGALLLVREGDYTRYVALEYDNQ
jgi:serine protease Do